MVDKETAIVVCTYKRKELLQVLFDSFAETNLKPGLIVIADNDNDPEVGEMCSALQGRLPEGADVVYAPQETNTGGAGGFSAGTGIAYARGATWIWLMDDDVKILPDALEKLRPWMDRAVADDRRVIQCRRLNYDGTPFYWQYHFLNKLGIPNPIAPSGFKNDETFRFMNTSCFEGGMFHRSIVKELGLPDYRFFIYWDDTVYGYLASKITQPILIKDILMARTRSIDNFKIGSVRKLNATSDMVRYYIMRNRGFMGRYFALHGDYKPFVFWLGTQITMLKEFIRLFINKGFKTGMRELRRGKRDAKEILRDANWQPMPKLD
ncbi:MAG: glycosyltransferase [Clostridiales Family XIII bacterium]|jgi:GT2 family glycosyltransferase|nr:glycosyltransferase [Clostridiales Family XIII bacterium]